MDVWDTANCVLVKWWTLVCFWSCSFSVCIQMRVNCTCVETLCLWVCCEVVCIFNPCVHVQKKKKKKSMVIISKLISAPVGALQLTWYGREVCVPEQGLLTGERCVQRACCGPDGTTKHSSFATAILFSHHFNFKELSGCISIRFG